MHLLDQAPDLYFFLTYTPHDPFTLFKNENGEWNARRERKGKIEVLHSEASVEHECKSWLASLDLEKIEILYVYGIGVGKIYDHLKPWLKNESQRRLIFLEDDLGVLSAFSKTEICAEILEDPQVVVRYVQNWDSELESLAQTFPYAEIEVTALPFYAKRHKQRLSRIRLTLLRNTSSYHALFSEALFSHKLLGNLSVNLRKLPSSFYANEMKGRYAGIPAIICGAGPSLKPALKALKGLENRALILAGGSTIAALSNNGVLPHLSMALDPNPEELQRLEAASAFEIPLLFASRLNSDVFSTCNGPLGYLKSDTGGVFETWMEERLSIAGETVGPDLGREAFSVTTLAAAFAYLLGCNPIIFVGVDLAYTGMKRYADGIMTQNALDLSALKNDKRATDRLVRRKDRQGNTIYTLVKWVMESECLSAYAKAHPDRTFLNATEGGIGFSEIPYAPLEKIIERYCTCTWDLRAKIHVDTQVLQMRTLSEARIDSLYEQLRLSLRRSLNLCEEIIDELSHPTAKKIVLELDFQEETAYKPLLEMPLLALDRLLDRYIHQTDVEREKIKWLRMKEIIESQMKTLS